jgi:hypothetical protein
MKLDKSDLSGSNTGSEDIDPQKVVDQNLSAQNVAGNGSMKEIMAEVRATIQEFNGLTQELKNNPTVAKAIANQGDGGNSFQQPEQRGEQEEMNISPDMAFQLFLNGVQAVKNQLGEDATLTEAEEFLNENEAIVKAQIEENL